MVAVVVVLAAVDVLVASGRQVATSTRGSSVEAARSLACRRCPRVCALMLSLFLSAFRPSSSLPPPSLRNAPWRKLNAWPPPPPQPRLDSRHIPVVVVLGLACRSRWLPGVTGSSGPPVSAAPSVFARGASSRALAKVTAASLSLRGVVAVAALVLTVCCLPSVCRWCRVQ